MIKKLKKMLNNRGSSFVVVIVSVAFLAILVASIMTAVGYSYKLKIYNLNSKNNFYYVEQALDEIYAGVGNIAINNLQQAYNDTVEVLVYYDTDRHTYRTMENDVANRLMKKTFMQYMKDDVSLSTADNPATGNRYIDDTLASYVTNPDISIDTSAVSLDTTQPGTVIVRNVTVKRSVKYSGGGSDNEYTQSITTDIVIGEPNYNITMDNSNSDHSALYDFAVVADKGIEISGATNMVNISGNVYAGADFYDKSYNTYGGKDDDVSAYVKNSQSYNDCDGLQESSMYSGIYIDGAKLTLQSNEVVVPGSIAVFNSGSLVVSAKDAGTVVAANIWADNITLGGYSRATGGATADIYANAYIYDDLEVDSDASILKMQGKFFGYNYSQSVDNRQFIAPAKDNYTDAKGDNKNYHYNSSSIILNGQNTTLDFEYLDALYIAGRSYIEMSKKIAKDDVTLDDDEVVETRTYTYDNSIEDYLTGESLSIKSNQLAYMPIKSWAIEEDNGKYYVKIPDNVQEPYEGFFATLARVPVIKQTVSDNDFYFFNFGAETDSAGNNIYKDVDKAKFIEAYAEYFKKTATGEYEETGAKYLKDITNYTKFEVDTITLPKDANIYSNGALTVKDLTTFSIVASKSSSDIFEDMLDDPAAGASYNYMDATSTLSSQYKLMKYFLTTQVTDENKNELQEILNKNESITPIKKYFNVSSITDLGSGSLDLDSGYRIWVSDGDITVTPQDSKSTAIKGIVIAKGDVFFSDSVTSFEGLIVSGSKVYIDHTMNFIANAEVVKAALRECVAMDTTRSKGVIACFKDYGEDKTGPGGEDIDTEDPDDTGEEVDADDIIGLDEKSIYEVDYRDVVDFENWKKNVE